MFATFHASRLSAILPAILLSPGSAGAHVKWFVPHAVDRAPEPFVSTLLSPVFWTGLLLVLIAFLAARAVERSRLGEPALAILDRVCAPLWANADEVFRLITAAFFIAIFSTGGTYLTPDLDTTLGWVSWLQLLIAVFLIPSVTRPVAGLAIMGLWLLALREYPFFHLLDYLLLVAGVAAYFVLEASADPQRRALRFEALRWGCALTLMWLALEKFAYPDRFHLMMGDNPLPTFGLSPNPFITLSGLAEFTMAFGMIWTPLIRRLSALALLGFFSGAIILFGRPDLIGHALFLGVFLVVIADPSREPTYSPSFTRRMGAVPTGLAAALLLFSIGHWGLHWAIYGPGERTSLAADREP
jgi:hypothetical protein